MKYFFDTEFIEDGRTIDLLSIGIVAEDGRELYLKNRDARLDKASEWVRVNVFPSLGLGVDDEIIDAASGWASRYRIGKSILAFIGSDKPEFWAYYADYDWVVFCQLFGRMIDLPKGWPMYCRDVKQLCDSLGNPKLPKQDGEHHALNDARWTKQAYEFFASRAGSTMTESEAAELAREVVRELFTIGPGRTAQRLVQEYEGVELNGPGWSARAATARLTDAILKHSKKMGMGKRR